MPLTFATPVDGAIPLRVVAADDLSAALDTLEGAARAWAKVQGFAAGPGETLTIPGNDGGIPAAWVGAGSGAQRRRQRFVTAVAARRLPAGVYRLEDAGPVDAEEFALGWLLEGYVFDRYATQGGARAELMAPEGLDAGRIAAIAQGEALTRRLIDTPANDMGPADLEAAARDLAGRFGAEVEVTQGDALRDGFPMIHTVGRAAAPHRAPRLIEMTWGVGERSLTLVGKGVCFDTGGLNIKPGSSMGLMKKDMGGAAATLGLAQMIMATGLPIRLRVLIPAVENAIGGDAFRPQDILTSRKGLTVEINNTDAEGRLVLADALALAAEAPSDLTISLATLTGAARVALGPDIAPFFADDEDVASAFAAAGARVADPVWRLPFHDPYEAMIEPGIADLDNAPKGGMAGAITAALFLRRFAPETYAHFDVYGWQPTAAPGRAKGGVGQGTRAILDALPTLMGL